MHACIHTYIHTHIHLYITSNHIGVIITITVLVVLITLFILATLLGSASINVTANLRTQIIDVRWFGSNIILIIRGGIPGPKGNSPESLSQAILVGIMLVVRLGGT